MAELRRTEAVDRARQVVATFPVPGEQSLDRLGVGDVEPAAAGQ